ncbi:hypothetical protein CQW23_05840 [Capsicum baccatum]|uniref:Uncharacterized protein n=1 Tax=Capsicum baccatum TaxID=33114 RepID=A0A2G2XIN5_CAPBA|nr:hypothetical protein CQW23_05840 [Capsicum baccatum]
MPSISSTAPPLPTTGAKPLPPLPKFEDGFPTVVEKLKERFKDERFRENTFEDARKQAVQSLVSGTLNAIGGMGAWTLKGIGWGCGALVRTVTGKMFHAGPPVTGKMFPAGSPGLPSFFEFMDSYYRDSLDSLAIPMDSLSFFNNLTSSPGEGFHKQQSHKLTGGGILYGCLEGINKEDIPLEFVPATFDEQDPDWAENRSKHRNDSVIVKKMTDKTVFKSKKSTSKASKKKFDDSGRPRLPKRNAIPRILNWSVECIRPKYESCMSGMFSKHSYKNIQPTTDEVSRLDLSFLKYFEICDPTNYASTSDSRNLKKTATELEQHIGTIAEKFGDLSTIPPREIFIKAIFASPVAPDQPLKKRKTVMFEQDNQVVMDDGTSGRGHAVYHGSGLYRKTHKDAADKGEIGVYEIQYHHHGEIGVSPQSHQHKSVPSSST